jgi:hypothetical protein
MLRLDGNRDPDYVDVVIPSYRHRLGLAPGYPQYANVEAKRRTAQIDPQRLLVGRTLSIRLALCLRYSESHAPRRSDE